MAPLLDRELCSAPAAQGGGQAGWLGSPRRRVERENSLVPECLGLARDPFSSHFLACPWWLLGQLTQLILSGIIWHGGESFVLVGGTSLGSPCNGCLGLPFHLSLATFLRWRLYGKVWKPWDGMHVLPSTHFRCLSRVEAVCRFLDFPRKACSASGRVWTHMVVLVCDCYFDAALMHLAQRTSTQKCYRNEGVFTSKFVQCKILGAFFFLLSPCCPKQCVAWCYGFCARPFLQNKLSFLCLSPYYTFVNGETTSFTVIAKCLVAHHFSILFGGCDVINEASRQ